MDFEVRMKIIRNQLETQWELDGYGEWLVTQNDWEISQLRDEISWLTEKALNCWDQPKLIEAFYWRIECLKRDSIFIERAQREIEHLQERVIGIYLERRRY